MQPNSPVQPSLSINTGHEPTLGVCHSCFDVCLYVVEITQGVILVLMSVSSVVRKNNILDGKAVTNALAHCIAL